MLYKNPIKIPVLYALLVILSEAGCSEGIEGPPLTPPDIKESYRSMAIHYNSQSVTGILAFYSPLFKHNGLGAADLDSLWNYRLYGGVIRIKEFALQTTADDSVAQCTLDVIYTKDNETDTIHIEPGQPYDDVCHWKKQEGWWKLSGNQDDATISNRPPRK